ncbi:ABC transporter permease [Bradyrhizobium sp.]|uniref:ABC transporter permease n=1 Tax=Bradyrhizobium sp. TaxID=376 RepID=UPI003C69D4BD
MGLLIFLLRRLVAAVPAVVALVVATFVIMRVLPGDPAVFFASSPVPTAEETAYVRHKFGLDRSLPEQLLIYFEDVGSADLGMSFTTGRPVLTELMQRLPASLELAMVALLLALAVSIPLGVAAAIWSGSPLDHIARIVSSIGVSMPTFVTGLMLTYVFFLRLGLAPEPLDRIDMFITAPPRVTGFLLIDSTLSGDWMALQSAAGRLVLPSVTMAIFVLSPLTRMTRSAMLGVLSSDFVRTARAMGLSDRTVYVHYALRNALLPVLTTIGIVFSTMLGSNVLVERVFGWPGIGNFALNALLASDYAPVQGFVLVMGLLLVAINLAIDVAYGLADPRARRTS